MSDERKRILRRVLRHYRKFSRAQLDNNSPGFPGMTLRSYVIDTEDRLIKKVMRCRNLKKLTFNWGDVDATSYDTRYALMNHMNAWGKP